MQPFSQRATIVPRNRGRVEPGLLDDGRVKCVLPFGMGADGVFKIHDRSRK